jgi:hypothetical protein
VFKVPGLNAPEFQKQGGEWEPDVHFTGNAEDVREVSAVQAIINRHADGIIAYYSYLPFTKMFSIELQFKNEDLAADCAEDYSKLFDYNGKLRK